MNKQAPETIVKERTGVTPKYDIVEIFPTIQAEGPFAGRPATFIRLAGCNLNCKWCDTDYTSGRRELAVGEIVKKVGELTPRPEIVGQAPLVVLTGGEPFRQPIRNLVEALVEDKLQVQIETNGHLNTQSFFEMGKWGYAEFIHLVVSPKTSRIHPKIVEEYENNGNVSFKYVLDSNHINPRDGLPSRVLGFPSKGVARPPKLLYKENIHVQPMYVENARAFKRNIAATVKSARMHGYSFSAQWHKWLGLP